MRTRLSTSKGPEWWIESEEADASALRSFSLSACSRGQDHSRGGRPGCLEAEDGGTELWERKSLGSMRLEVEVVVIAVKIKFERKRQDQCQEAS